MAYGPKCPQPARVNVDSLDDKSDPITQKRYGPGVTGRPSPNGPGPEIGNVYGGDVDISGWQKPSPKG